MTTQTQNAIDRYLKSLERALVKAPREVSSEAVQDAEEFLVDEVHAMDVGRLSSEDAAFDRFVYRFGTPQQLAASYLEQTDRVPVSGSSFRRNQLAAAAVLFLIAVTTTGSFCYAMLREPPKLSPFTEVQFERGKVFVTFDGKSCEWLEIDEIKVGDIVVAAKKQFGDRWQKRISEDLVEVLWGMDHQPGETVQLRLIELKTKRSFIVKNTPMTEQNRWAVYQKRREVEGKDTPDAAPNEEPPKVSPFTDISFEADKVNVSFDGKNCQWIKIDGVSVKDIIKSSKKQFGERWQKRISEDLVEVLWGMDHRPGESVSLQLLNLDTNEMLKIKNAPMTKSNRSEVYAKRRQIEEKS